MISNAYTRQIHAVLSCIDECLTVVLGAIWLLKGFLTYAEACVCLEMAYTSESDNIMASVS